MLNALRNYPGITVVSLLIIGLMIWGFWPQPVLVEAVSVKRAPLTVTIEEDGRTRVIDRYVISAPVNGVASRLILKVGDAIEQGQTILNITPLESQGLDPRSRAQAQAQVFAAESALRATKEQARAAAASSKLAQDELKRYQTLMEKGLISRESFDKVATEAATSAAAKRSANFNVEVARYELEAARTMLQVSTATANGTSAEKVLVNSPVNGRIFKIVHLNEGPVSTGEPLLEVGDPSALEIEVDVLSADAVKIKPGMKVLFERWGGQQPLEGRVRTVEPIGVTKVSALGVEEQRVLIISDFVSPIEEWQRLGDGYRVEARFITWQEADVLQVPSSSLFRYKDGWAVFVMENGRAIRREVTIGQRNGLDAQILSGLQDTEKVINHPSDAIEHNTRIKERTY